MSGAEPLRDDTLRQLRGRVVITVVRPVRYKIEISVTYSRNMEGYRSIELEKVRTREIEVFGKDTLAEVLEQFRENHLPVDVFGHPFLDIKSIGSSFDNSLSFELDDYDTKIEDIEDISSITLRKIKIPQSVWIERTQAFYESLGDELSSESADFLQGGFSSY